MLKNTILEIEKEYGELYGIMAHSLGGIAAALSAEELDTLQKLVLIAPATETQRAIDNFFKFVPLGNSIKEELVQYIIELAQQPLSYFSVVRSVQQHNKPTLWLHDEDDDMTPLSDALKVKEDNHPNIKFVITKGLGHRRIYHDAAVKKAVIDFL